MKSKFKVGATIAMVAVSVAMSAFAGNEFGGELALSSVEEEKDGFIVKEYDGLIGIFVPGENLPTELTKIETKYLPNADRMELKKGIFTENSEELAMILEDFGS